MVDDYNYSFIDFDFIKEMKIIIGILCITGLEVLAIIKGYNGVILTASISAIAGILGFQIRGLKK